MRKVLPKLSIFIIIAIYITFGVYALDITSVEQMSIDETSIVQQENFGLPKSIIVTPLFIKSDMSISYNEWYKGIHYYQTQKLGQGDIGFHYVISNTGKTIKGNTKGEWQRLQLDTDINAPIIIGYLANSNDIDFDIQAKQSLAELILEIANSYNIELQNISVAEYSISVDSNNIVKAKLDNLSGRWERSIKTIIDEISPQYNPKAKNIQVSVEEVIQPSMEVSIEENVVLSIKIKNNSQYPLIAGTEYEPIVSLVNGNISKFHLNGIWLSLTQFSVMPENSFIMPGQTATYQMRISVPLYFGEVKETFQLTDSLNRTYENTRFDINLNIKRSEKQIVEIINTPTGQLNVRATPSASGEISSRVTPGQRFIVLERSGNGWVRIDLGDSKSGWVAQQYTRAI
jgi:hypothetical protein